MKKPTRWPLPRPCIIVETMDGAVHSGASFSEVVESMRKRAWGGSDSVGIRGYMKQVAKRVMDWSKKHLRIATPEMFVRDMERAGLARIVRS